MVTHVVLFKFKDPTAENLGTAAEKLRGLMGVVPTLKALEVGINQVPSDRAFDMTLLTRFASMEDLDAYRTHPKHQEVVAHLKTVVEKSHVVDYTAP